VVSVRHDRLAPRVSDGDGARDPGEARVEMNGAQALMRTFVASGLDVCFTNPGTSEMHFVAALDAVPRMRAVLGLFEGVVTGAADGWARMAGRPAGALLHLGPGLGNGLANLHNARRARTPVVAVVGEHARPHRGLGAPLESDIATVARNVSTWVRTSATAAAVGRDAAEAVAAAQGPPGQVATLILPADVSWSDGGVVADVAAVVGRPAPTAAAVTAAAAVLRSGAPTLLLLGGTAAADPQAIATAHGVADATGARVLTDVFPARVARGAGRAPLERIAYFPEQAQAQLADLAHIVLVEAPPPVSFFAYPGERSRPTPPDCAFHTLAGVAEDGPAALAALAGEIGAAARTATVPYARPQRPTGPLDAASLAAVVGALLPEGAIVSDEAITTAAPLPGATAGAPPHDWLTLTGGAIGQGLPVATGAAVACPDRPVIALEADGSALYTIQSLWTQAREGLDVTTVICSNGSYEILSVEMDRVGVEGAGSRAAALFDLTGPRPDFVTLAAGFGVPATRASTAAELADQLAAALATPGPALIEAMIPRVGGPAA
jgi:acetolactate synthase-1/2/3 large subunit